MPKVSDYLTTEQARDLGRKSNLAGALRFGSRTALRGAAQHI
jgi:hypothetical protein